MTFSGLSMYEFSGDRIRRNTDSWDSVQVIARMKLLPTLLRFDEL